MSHIRNSHISLLMHSFQVDIGVGFAAVGLLSLRGVLGYAGWRWLFLVE